MPISGLDESRARLEQLRTSLDLSAKEEELRVLEAQSGREDFWDDADKARAHLRHAQTVKEALDLMGVHLPIFGMVKDNRHRTRALVTPEGQEIGIQATPAVFALIGRIQEETHRFAITYHRTLRSKRVKGSQLDGIEGIGEKRRLALLRHFKSVSAIRSASLEELETVLPHTAAEKVYAYFRSEP